MTNQSGFFCGIALGVAAGILLAPRAGGKTRAMIGENARRSQDVLQDLLKQKSCETLDAAMSAVERGKAAAQRTADGIADAIAMGKQTLAG